MILFMMTTGAPCIKCNLRLGQVHRTLPRCLDMLILSSHPNCVINYTAKKTHSFYYMMPVVKTLCKLYTDNYGLFYVHYMGLFVINMYSQRSHITTGSSL